MDELELIESVIGLDALYDSMLKCVKGVLWKDSVASFFLRAGENISKLHQDLQDGTYKAKPPKHFKITSPKPREIASVAFRDRVFQRSLNDNVVYPTMTRSFIYDNFACQKGKGTDAARERLKEFLRKYFRLYGKEGFVCQLILKAITQTWITMLPKKCSEGSWTHGAMGRLKESCGNSTKVTRDIIRAVSLCRSLAFQCWTGWIISLKNSYTQSIISGTWTIFSSSTMTASIWKTARIRSKTT